MKDSDISSELRAKLAKLIVTEGKSDPEATVEFLLMAATDVLRLSYPPEATDTKRNPLDEFLPREEPIMSREGFAVLLRNIVASAEQATGYSLTTFLAPELRGKKDKTGGGIVSPALSDLSERLVAKGIEPAWIIRSLVNAATKMALVKKVDRNVVIYILLRGITSMTEPSALLDITSLIDQMAEEFGISKEDALKRLQSMMETFGG
ncbi:hypothetical protein [Pseudomonas amygdali]|uniref:Uncharacterized protein n=2 Tax=Pseudomonas amygdali pv. lachrymans TaxID=53707 RepID=A0AAD0PWX1_PSEAV|nr:hypothetical protein [Pseudomonas amygdali]AXH60227.1 hypothetical protein PLA107_034130 [Pseudomonas amygdali pv. lachrymans str. M301315]RMT05938.1 hypothetical protein ALP54_04059 [Pseudomonas amygdali pv. lachrymans]